MHHVFLSHSSKDHNVALKFYDDLLKLSFRVWLDEVEMEPSDSLIQKIGIALRSSMNLAVLLSADSIGSQWVQKEVSIAVRDKLSGANVNVVPIRLDDTEPPPFLADIIPVDEGPEAAVAEPRTPGGLVLGSRATNGGQVDR